jgi:Domain of unknown function (DUF2017)
MSSIGPDGFPADDDDRMGPGEPSGAEPGGLSEPGEPGELNDRGEAADNDLDDEELAATFRPIPGGAACYFAPAQAGVIRSLVGQVAELIRGEDGLSGTGVDPADPADVPGGLGAPGLGGPGGPDVPGGQAGAGAGPGAGSAGSGESVPGTPSPDELERMLGFSGNVELPDDPVLARLLPDAYSDDAEASAEFRRYTEESLRAGKINSARAVLASLPAGGGDVVLSESECQMWLKALNDVRLALGVRLGITDENEDPLGSVSADDPRSAYLWVYQWLAYLQDSLIESLS